MAFSLRLDPKTDTRIRRLAMATGRTRAAIVRDAVEHYAAAEIQEVKFARSLYDRLRPFAGVVSTEAELSTDTHAKFRAVLERKRNARRSR